MSNRRKRNTMALMETGLRVTEDFVLSHNASGEVLNEYRRHKTPLFRLYEAALRKGRAGEMAEYTAGSKFAELYRQSGLDPWQRASRSDTTRIVVDGAGRAPDELSGSDGAKISLERMERVLGPSYAVLVGVCGQELTLTEYGFKYKQDWRAVKRKLKYGLARLVEWFKKN